MLLHGVWVALYTTALEKQDLSREILVGFRKLQARVEGDVGAFFISVDACNVV